MMSDFEATMRHEEYISRIRKKWQKEGRKYRQTIKRMENEREENYQKKNEQLLKKLKEKDQTMITALDANRQAKMAEKRKNIEMLIKKEENAKKIVEENLKQQEEVRLKNEVMINERIERFKERNLQIKMESHEKVVQKNYNTEVTKAKNIAKLNEEIAITKRENEDKAFQKYVAFYFHKKDIEQAHKNLVKKSKNKLAEKEERLEELERQHEQRRKELLKKMREMEKKKEESEKEKQERLERERQRRIEKFERCQENKSIILKEQDEIRKDILDYQNYILGRGVNKDNITTLKRINAK